MEVVTFSVLSAFVVQVLCVVSYICYRHFKSQSEVEKDVKPTLKVPDKKKTQKDKSNLKQKNKKKQIRMKPKIKDNTQDSDTESFSMVDQLAQAIMQDHGTVANINTEAVNERPKVKKHQVVKGTSQPSKAKNSNNKTSIDGESWESVTNRKHKAKIELSQTSENTYRFTLDENGGIVETPLCEIHFPGECVTEPLTIRMETERYDNIVDESGEKFLFTPVIHFAALGSSQLLRRFTMKLNTMNIMGRGWNLGVYGQIETSENGVNNWTSYGRTEYQFRKPIQIVHDTLTNFRCVITRSQNSSVSRRLNVALYIAKTKLQDPDFHTVHICVYDQTPQSLNRVESSMQKHVLKLQPKDCDVPFGCDLHFKIQPGQKFDPEDKEIFMRWSEICKASVFVKLQLRLNKKIDENAPNEGEFRTLVYLSILKQNGDFKATQNEYFHFYWVSGNIFANRYKNARNNDRKTAEKRDRTISETGSYITSAEQYSGFESSKPNLDDLVTLGGSHGDWASPFVKQTGKAKRKKNKEMKRAAASLEEDDAAADKEEADKMNNASAISSKTSSTSNVPDPKVQNNPDADSKTPPKVPNDLKLDHENQAPRKSHPKPRENQPLKPVERDPPNKVDSTAKLPTSSPASDQNHPTSSIDQAKRSNQPNNSMEKDKSASFAKNRNFQRSSNYRPRNPSQGGVDRFRNPPQSGGNKYRNPPRNSTVDKRSPNNLKQFDGKTQNAIQTNEKSPKSSPKKETIESSRTSSPVKAANNILNKKPVAVQDKVKDSVLENRGKAEEEQNKQEKERKTGKPQNHQGIKSENHRNFHPNQRFNRSNYQRNKNFPHFPRSDLQNGGEPPHDNSKAKGPIEKKETPIVPHDTQNIPQTTPKDNPQKENHSSQSKPFSDRNEMKPGNFRSNFRNSSVDSRFLPQNQRNYRTNPRQFHQDQNRPFYRQNEGRGRNFTPRGRGRGYSENQNRGEKKNFQRSLIRSSTWTNSKLEQTSDANKPTINSSPKKQQPPKAPKSPSKEPKGTPNGYQDHPVQQSQEGSSKEPNGPISWAKETSSGDWAEMAPPPPTRGEIAPYGEPLKVQSITKPAPKDRRERPVRKRSEVNHH